MPVNCRSSPTTPAAGTAVIAGHDIQAEPLRAKSIFGYIPDNPFLYEKLTGREFLNFMADLYSVDTAGRSRKIDDGYVGHTKVSRSDRRLVFNSCN